MGNWTDLVNEGDLPLVETALEQAVERSFLLRPMRHRTGAETTRRVRICIGIFEGFREMGWSTRRSIDHLLGGLIAFLDQRPVEPSKRSTWAVSPTSDLLTPLDASGFFTLNELRRLGVNRPS
jgi:hypothetical protein